jgi:hypothetical protein
VELKTQNITSRGHVKVQKCAMGGIEFPGIIRNVRTSEQKGVRRWKVCRKKKAISKTEVKKLISDEMTGSAY